jgi:hypothetical protein
MSNKKSTTDVLSKLARFHTHKADTVLTTFSDIAGPQFEGEFNVSGFHREVLDLPRTAKSLWGVDQCLRIQEVPDCTHSYLFHMGIFARSVDLNGEYTDPFKDPRFHALQKEIIVQFLELLAVLGADLAQLEITYLGEMTFGASNGRDKLLKRKYHFPTDNVSKKFLQGKAALVPIHSLANVDVNPVEGALVGPRLEVAYRGIEIGTIVFDCFKIANGRLVPINYVAGYAIGIERLTAVLETGNLLTSIPRYRRANAVLARRCRAAMSSLLEKVLYGAEALAHIPSALSRHQRQKARSLRKRVAESLAALGGDEAILDELISLFKREASL